MIKFIRNSYRINFTPDPDNELEIMKYLEMIGRVCYKSEDKITEDSAIKFINMLRDRKHWAMLEHYIISIRIKDQDTWDALTSSKFRNCGNADLQRSLNFISADRYADFGIVTGSFTAFNNLIDTINKSNDEALYAAFGKLLSFLHEKYPNLIIELNYTTHFEHIYRYTEDDFKILPKEYISNLPVNLRINHDWLSVKFIVERSSTHDLVRHRLASYAQESTRYCNYANKGLEFIIPCQFSKCDKEFLEDPDVIDEIINSSKRHDLTNACDLPGVICSDLYNQFKIDMKPSVIRWVLAINNIANVYTDLVSSRNWSVQEAKSVLPQCLKAEINITATLQEWHHIFDMRASKAAFPQIQEVMYPLLGYAIDMYPGIFDDLKSRYEEGGSYGSDITRS